MKFRVAKITVRSISILGMSVLVQAGLDFETVQRELENQVDLLGEELFVTDVNKSLLDLEERFGVTTPIRSVLATESARVYRELEVLMAFDEQTMISTLATELERPEEALCDLLDSLDRLRSTQTHLT